MSELWTTILPRLEDEEAIVLPVGTSAAGSGALSAPHQRRED